MPQVRHQRTWDEKDGAKPFDCFYSELETEKVTNTSLDQSQHLLHLCPKLRHLFTQRSDLCFHLSHTRARPSGLDQPPR